MKGFSDNAASNFSLIFGFDQVNNIEITCYGSGIRKEDLVTSVRMTCRCQGVKQSSINFTVQQQDLQPQWLPAQRVLH